MSLRIRFWPTLFTVVGLAILISLGTWQLRSYLEARDFEERRDARLDTEIVDLEAPLDLESGDYDFRRVRLEGRWGGDTTFLVKHRVFRGDPGFWVVDPLLVGHGDMEVAVLVNRGWIPFDDGRNRAETLLAQRSEDTQSVVGLVHPLDRVITDDKVHRRLDDQPHPGGVVELDSYDTTAMNRAIDYPTIDRPVVLTLGPEQTGDDSYPVASYEHVTDRYLTSETHFGYMLTWYLLGLALIAIWIAGSLGMLGSRRYDEPGAT